MSLEKVVEYCCSCMNRRALDYLVNERRLTEQTIKEWQIGYCPYEIDDLANSISRDILLKQKIVIEGENGLFSFMRNSVVFPLINQYGEVVAVSSRPLQSAEEIKRKRLRKYWNSSFEKSSFLYGLNRAMGSIRETDKVIIGEGQIDVLMAHQYGFTNTVGTCGTALSIKHIALLGRYATEIIVVFDGDSSGQRAAAKLNRKMLPNIDIKSVTMPSGEDIDSFLLSCGTEEFDRVLKSAISIAP